MYKKKRRCDLLEAVLAFCLIVISVSPHCPGVFNVRGRMGMCAGLNCSTLCWENRNFSSRADVITPVNFHIYH